MEILSRASVRNTMLMGGMLFITYINHLKDIDIRKDITTIEAEKRKRQEAEPTYKDFKWDTSPLSRVARSKS